MGEGELRHLTCAQACGQCEQCSHSGLQVTSDGDTTDMPPLGNGSSDEEGSHAVQLQERSVRSVVESDMQDPRCADYRAHLMGRFKTVFGFPENILDVGPALRGNHEDSVAVIHLKNGAVPQRVAPYRTVGVRDAAFRELIAKFFRRGMSERSHSAWAARAFLVSKPGGKWRLVVDYRYLNSQKDGEQ